MYAAERIEPEEFVIEYVGEAIRVSLADARERLYQVRNCVREGVVPGPFSSRRDPLASGEGWVSVRGQWCGEGHQPSCGACLCVRVQAMGLDDYMFRIDSE